AAGGQLVLDRELSPPADTDLVVGVQQFLKHAGAVDLDAVGAVHVADAPVAFLERELGVNARDVGVAHADVARLAPPDRQRLADQWDAVAAAERDEFAVGLEHGLLSRTGTMTGLTDFSLL